MRRRRRVAPGLAGLVVAAAVLSGPAPAAAEGFGEAWAEALRFEEKLRQDVVALTQLFEAMKNLRKAYEDGKKHLTVGPTLRGVVCGDELTTSWCKVLNLRFDSR